jgi:urate oxidase
MSAILGDNCYGKAECRLVHIARSGDQHELVDLNVSTSLAGELSATHRSGDNTDVLPTDTQKNTVYAFARQHGVGAIEEFGLRLARHFVAEQPKIHQAVVRVERYGWERVGRHSFVRSSNEVRSAVLTCAEAPDGGRQSWVVGGVTGLTLLNTTDSEFWGFTRDEFTTLPETRDRVLATALDAAWRLSAEGDESWDEIYHAVRAALIDAFATTYSYSLQQTLFSMGQAVMTAVPRVQEIRLALPNRHHFLVDLTPFELDNPNEVYFPADRPYGLIEGTVLREGATAAGQAWAGARWGRDS